MFEGSETVCLSLSAERDFGRRFVQGGILGRGSSGREGEVGVGLVGWKGGRGRRGRVKGVGGGAGDGFLGVGDELVDFVGGTAFWGGLLGGESRGGDSMGGGEEILCGEMGAAVSVGL